MKAGIKHIDFKFARNWKAFLTWHDEYLAKAKVSPMWDEQMSKIKSCFEPSNPNVINWKSLWKEFLVWYKEILTTKEIVLWNEQKRQIETLMLKQLEDLNKEHFVLAYLYKGKPRVDSSEMTYWDALRIKENLEGDSNGLGGDERMDKITIVNLNKLIG